MLSGRRARRKHSGYTKNVRMRLGLGQGPSEEMEGRAGYQTRYRTELTWSNMIGG
jgi:hypothetical protein